MQTANLILIAAERQRGSTLFLTLHDVLAFSCPVLPAELCIVEISIEFRGDVGFPGHIMYSSSFVNLRGLFNKILYSVFIYIDVMKRGNQSKL